MLRIGDLVMHTTVIRWLHNQGWKVDLLTNRENRGLLPCISGVEKSYIFDRELVQFSVGDDEVPAETGLRHIHLLVDEINKSKYDLIINLTNTNLSARFVDLVNAKEKVGLFFDNGQIRYSGQGFWADYVNLFDDFSQGSRFHFVDIFLSMVGRKYGEVRPALIESERGKLEAFDLVEHKDFIIVQGLTSDEKKNWGLENWEQLIWQLQLQIGLPVYVLCSPQEKIIYEAQFSKELLKRIRLCETSLEGALSLLKAARLLITGDTAIKHMASSADLPTIEIILGSSKYSETAYYGTRGVLLINREICAPCRHSDACSRDRHYCALRIRPNAVASVAKSVLEGDHASLHEQAMGMQSDCLVKMSNIDGSGYWYTLSVSPQLSIDERNDQVERSIWKYYLNNDPSAEIGLKAEAFDLAARLEFSSSELQTMLGEAEAYFQDVMEFDRAWNPERINKFLNRNLSMIRIQRELQEFKAIRDGAEAQALNDTRYNLWLTGVRLRASFRIALLKELSNQGEKNEKRSRTTP